MDKQPILSITKKDLRIDYYRGTGKGGQKRNKTENCCRITHLDSGAVGKSEEGRSKEHNKRAAFQRMHESAAFQAWYKLELARALGQMASIEGEVGRAMDPANLKIEIKNETGQWAEVA